MHKDFSLRRHARKLVNVDKRADIFPGVSLPSVDLPTIGLGDPLGIFHSSSTSSSPTHTRSVVTITTVVLKSTSTPASSLPVVVNPSSASSLSSLSSSSSSSSSPSLSSSSSSSARPSTASSTSSRSSSSIVQVTPTSSSSRAVAPIVPSSASIAGAASSPSTSDVSATGTSSGSIAGIAVGVIGGIVLLVGVVFFLMRRKRRNNEALSEDYFNAGRFKRQSVVLVDDVPSPMYGSTGGINPRPPTMVDRHSTNFAGFGAARNLTPGDAPLPPSKDQGHGYNQYGNVNPGMYNIQPSFAPGAIVSQQQYQNVYYNPPTQSPIGSPTHVSPYPSAYDDAGRLIRSPSTATSPVNALSRSVGSRSMNDSVDEDADTSIGGYANMSRVSVTPFQAAQYEAISKQLNVPPPLPRMSIVGPQAERSMATSDDRDMSRDTDSPFADPDTSVRSADEEAVTIRGSKFDNESGFDSRRNSGASVELPLPPVPMAESPTSRITSIPPVLPEILLQQRPFSPVDSYHFSTTGSVTSSPVVSTFAASERSPMGSSFVGTLGHSDSNDISPIGSTFDRSAFEQTFPVSAQASPSSMSFNFAGGAGGASVPPRPLLPVPPKPALTRVLGTSPVGQSALRNEVSVSREEERVVQPPAPVTTSAVAMGKKKEQPAFRPESMYDDEDAYGDM